VLWVIPFTVGRVYKLKVREKQLQGGTGKIREGDALSAAKYIMKIHWMKQGTAGDPSSWVPLVQQHDGGGETTRIQGRLDDWKLLFQTACGWEG